MTESGEPQLRGPPVKPPPQQPGRNLGQGRCPEHTHLVKRRPRSQVTETPSEPASGLRVPLVRVLCHSAWDSERPVSESRHACHRPSTAVIPRGPPASHTPQAGHPQAWGSPAADPARAFQGAGLCWDRNHSCQRSPGALRPVGTEGRKDVGT